MIMDVNKKYVMAELDDEELDQANGGVTKNAGPLKGKGPYGGKM